MIVHLVVAAIRLKIYIADQWNKLNKTKRSEEGRDVGFMGQYSVLYKIWYKYSLLFIYVIASHPCRPCKHNKRVSYMGVFLGYEICQHSL